MNELGKLVRPQSPTRTCQISPEDSSHIGHILSETQLKDKCGVKLLGMRSNEIVCALSSKTIFLSNSGQVVSNIDLPYYWCNFCAFKTEDKRLLLRHLMEHRFNCQYCIYQTFSRVDVVRHMVKEHNQFDSENFKFCVLLPDLLKYEMNNCDDKNSEQRKSPTPPLFQHVEEETEEKPKRKRGRPKKRCLTDQTPSPKKKKVEEEEGKRKLGSDNTTIVTPGVCFECCLCKFRTLQNSILTAHNNSEHGRPRPSLSLKLVSQSQAKEIEEMDKKISVKIERCPKPVETPTEEEQKDQSTQENDKDDENINDDTEKDFVRSSKKRKNEKKNREREFVNPRNTEKRMYKCLLCTNKVSDQFSIVKQHYIEEHPGGTQAMCEFDVDGSSEKINYFCVGDNCEFQDTEVLSWLSHLCMKNAMKKLNPQNSCTEDIPVTVIENLGLLVVQNPKPTESEPVIGDLQLSPVKQAVQNIKQEVSDNVQLPSSHKDQTLESVPVYNLALPENDRSDKENVFFQNQPKIQKQPDKNNHMSQVTDMILAQSYNALKERIQIRNKNSIQVRSEQFNGTAPEYICGNGDFSDIVTAGITSSRSASSAPTISPSSTSGCESGKRIIHGPFENRGRNWALTTSTPNQENSNKNVQEDEEDEVVIVGMTGGQFVTSPPYSNPSSSTSSYQANSIAEDNLEGPCVNDDTPEAIQERTRLRREANNARERVRIRGMNNLFSALGQMIFHDYKVSKPQTKRMILQHADHVIKSLSQEIRDPNFDADYDRFSIPQDSPADEDNPLNESHNQSEEDIEDQCDDNPEAKEEKERKRNSARERKRIHDINKAFQALGETVTFYCRGRQVTTKLMILEEAINVIINLRNLKVASRSCREKEKCKEIPHENDPEVIAQETIIRGNHNEPTQNRSGDIIWNPNPTIRSPQHSNSPS